MPTTVTTTHTKDGALIRLELVRRSGADVGITIEIVETDSRDGVPESSRKRVFHNEDLTATQVANLTALFNQIETRIKTNHYS
jgi:hypothetical protein